MSVFQLVKGIRYTITVELSNTQCKKSTELRTCDFYPELHKLKVGCVVHERERDGMSGTKEGIVPEYEIFPY